MLLVDTRYRQHLSIRACGDDDILRCVLLLANHYRMGILETGRAINQSDARLLHQGLYPTAQLFYHLLLTSHHLLEVDRRFSCLDTEYLRLLQRQHHLRITSQGLRRDTTTVQTGTTGMLFLDDDNGETVACGMFCRTISTGSCSDNDQIRCYHDYSAFA